MMPLVNRKKTVNTPFDIPNILRARLVNVLNAVTIESETRFRFADLDPVDTSIPAIPNYPQLNLPDAMSPLIYNYCYSRVFEADSTPGSDTHNQPPVPHDVQTGSPDEEFAGQLWAEQCSRQRWDPGWKVYQTEATGALHVEKEGSYRLVQPGQYVFGEGINRSPGVGNLVDLLVQPGSKTSQPGFHFFFGETVPSDYDDALMARFYFHLQPKTAPWLLKTIGSHLNRFRIPFRIKCLNNPKLYNRTDPLILYVAKRYIMPVMRILGSHRGMLAKKLLDGTPLFTKELLTGLGAGDEPGNGMSFGQHRSILLSKGIVDAWRQGDQSVEGRLNKIHERFEINGLCLSRPYLNEGTADPYQWPESGRTK